MIQVTIIYQCFFPSINFSDMQYLSYPFCGSHHFIIAWKFVKSINNPNCNLPSNLSGWITMGYIWHPKDRSSRMEVFVIVTIKMRWYIVESALHFSEINFHRCFYAETPFFNSYWYQYCVLICPYYVLIRDVVYLWYWDMMRIRMWLSWVYFKNHTDLCGVCWIFICAIFTSLIILCGWCSLFIIVSMNMIINIGGRFLFVGNNKRSKDLASKMVIWV